MKRFAGVFVGVSLLATPAYGAIDFSGSIGAVSVTVTPNGASSDIAIVTNAGVGQVSIAIIETTASDLIGDVTVENLSVDVNAIIIFEVSHRQSHQVG